MSAIEGFGGRSDFGEGVKNCKLFEEFATSSCNLAATKIAPRNPHEAKNSTFYEFINTGSGSRHRRKKRRQAAVKALLPDRDRNHFQPAADNR
ncbi:MAG: hypothetical protein R6W95_16915 [Desulfosarcina sp.]